MTITVVPGQLIGLVGGGQLGRMFVMAAQQLGYKVRVLTLQSTDPAAQIADEVIVADYQDSEAYKRLASGVAVVTYEFEGVSAQALKAIEKIVPVYPNPDILYQLQNRNREKKLLRSGDFPIGACAEVNCEQDLIEAIEKIGFPAVLKTANGGYDGKGQVKLDQSADVNKGWQALGQVECIVEQWIKLDKELSVVVARDQFSGIATYGPFENLHANHILDLTKYPAQVSEEIAKQACELASRFSEQHSIVGVVCIEFFLDQSGQLLINEIAPRPHNSGHLTIEAFSSSQFDQQVRTVCGLPVMQAVNIGPAAMVNLLGDLWANGEPDWSQIESAKDLQLHLYGKADAKPGRKMGHLTALAANATLAGERVKALRQQLISS